MAYPRCIDVSFLQGVKVLEVWLSEQLGWTAAFDDPSGVWQDCGIWLAPSHWYLRASRFKAVRADWETGELPQSVLDVYHQTAHNCRQFDNVIIVSHIEKSEKNLAFKSPRVNRLPVDLVFAAETTAGSGGKAAVYRLFWVNEILHDQFCLTTTCKFVLGFRRWVAFLWASRFNEGSAGLADLLGTSVIICSLSKSFWGSARVHLCLSLWNFHPWQVESGREVLPVSRIVVRLQFSSTSWSWPEVIWFEDFLSICNSSSIIRFARSISPADTSDFHCRFSFHTLGTSICFDSEPLDPNIGSLLADLKVQVYHHVRYRTFIWMVPISLESTR